MQQLRARRGFGMNDSAPTVASFRALPVFCAQPGKPVLGRRRTEKPVLREHEQRRRAKKMRKQVPIRLWETHSWTKQILRIQPRAVVAARAGISRKRTK